MTPCRSGTRLRGAFLCAFTAIGLGFTMGGNLVRGQQEIGFIEKFALAEDRRAALAELIPGTDDYYFYHCLHFQNEGQLAQAQAILDAWRTKSPGQSVARDMLIRQQLLSYSENPERTLQMLRDELGLQLNHQRPNRDQAAQLPNALDNSQLDIEALLTKAIAQDSSLSTIETTYLPALLDMQLANDQLRALLGRLPRADLPGLVERIAEELKLRDSQGFGWAGVHQLLTLDQLDSLSKLIPNLLENEAFLRAYAARLAPPAGTLLTDKGELRTYLERLNAWTSNLPPSQNSFKAYVLGNLLQLNLSEGKFDRGLFLKYLALPRRASYYNLKLLDGLRVPEVALNFALQPQVPLPPIQNDAALVRRYLEHFLQSDANVDAFAAYLDREYLDRVLAETKILYGLGDAATWYAKLSPTQQRELRDRIELRFSPQNLKHFAVTDDVRLTLELKNIDQVIVRIYQVNTLSYYRKQSSPIDINLDLDGLVANSERKIEFTQPADRRHSEVIDFPEMQGRGVWIVDILGGGERSRAVIHKGRLLNLERMGDAGQVHRIVDEGGQPVPNAHIELNNQSFMPNERGEIILPYAEQVVTRNVLLVVGNFATQVTLANLTESYKLHAGFLIDRQSLVAGTRAQVVISSQLACNDVPIDIKLLEDAKLSITATDGDGIETSQHIDALDLQDGDELTQSFLVPQRLRQIRFELSGRVANQSLNVKQELSASHTVACNAIAESNQIGDFFLRHDADGYQLLVLGRNGEALARQPVTIAVKLRPFTRNGQFNLATNADGIVALGQLENAANIVASAPSMASSTFDLTQFERSWPATMQIGSAQSIELALGIESIDKSNLSLMELRGNSQFANHSDLIETLPGSIRIQGLPAGDFVLQDYQTGQRVFIRSSDAKSENRFAVGEHRVLQTDRRAALVIRNATVEGDNLVIRVDGADANSRLHIVAGPFFGESLGSQLRLPAPPLSYQSRPTIQSLYVDSLRLDEEYSYILNRQRQKKYPGNMLPHPSVLVNPWEVSVTENTSLAAAAGDALPSMAPPGDPSDDMQRISAREGAVERPDWKSYDFLRSGSQVLSNLAIEDGVVRVPLEQLAGTNALTILAVHPTSLDSRHLSLPITELQLRDQRLRDAFDATQRLAQLQRVQVLKVGEETSLGDARTRRLQTYANIGGVFQLYATILNDPEWEKFRFLTQWHKLSGEQKQAHYSEMACHELDFFLYHKDRAFFDSVVKPLIENKQDKQLVDDWLLGRPLDQYVELWRLQRLNTLERVLLAERIQAMQAGTQRWLSELPKLDPQWRQRRFEVALQGNLLDRSEDMFGVNFSLAESAAQNDATMPASSADYGRGMMGGMGAMGGDDVAAKQSGMKAEMLGRGGRARMQREKLSLAEGEAQVDAFRALDRSMLSAGEVPLRFFQSLDKTREWAETQYHQVRLSDQTADLIPANPFWLELLEHGGKPFLSEYLDIPCVNVHEALCALAVIDLPLDGKSPEVSVVENQLVVAPGSATIAYVESIDVAQAGEGGDSVLVGQDIYLADASASEDANRPVDQRPLLAGIPYRVNVVVTNPTSSQVLVSVLTQIPAGAIPLSGNKLTDSQSTQLDPYSTKLIEYAFYFPQAGQFEHYGAQVNGTQPSGAVEHLASSDSRVLTVLAEPESVDESTWAYLADWGTDEQVLAMLKSANLRKLDLSRIAFRMQDRAFFEAVTSLLATSGTYEPTLWAYAVKHNLPKQISQLLQNRPEFIQRLGAVLSSELLTIDPREQFTYEHLDYRPLVAARIHQLGPKPKILNASMHAQYHSLLGVIAHQPAVQNQQRLPLCYYLLLQNRIEEAIAWFDQLDADSLETKLQRDYFAAYLDFYRGEYDRAAKIASAYIEYPVPRWQNLFAQIAGQVKERNALISSESIEVDGDFAAAENAQQRMLTGARETQQAAIAANSPVLELSQTDGRLMISYKNLEQVQVNYYLMDIELLFSRNPFVVRGDDQVPVIEANLSAELKLDATANAREIEIPADIINRNVLVEATAAGLSRSRIVTANSLSVNVVERMGRLQVLGTQDSKPVVGAYVKVYAQRNDGSVHFYKDGYTDLRGQFDYATLSTSDLDDTKRFAILVLDAEKGAVVREANIPTR